jgi:hypothetical protein
MLIRSDLGGQFQHPPVQISAEVPGPEGNWHSPNTHKTDFHLLGGPGTTHLKKRHWYTIFVLDGHPPHTGNGITWTGTLVSLFWKNAHSF